MSTSSPVAAIILTRTRPRYCSHTMRPFLITSRSMVWSDLQKIMYVSPKNDEGQVGNKAFSVACFRGGRRRGRKITRKRRVLGGGTKWGKNKSGKVRTSERRTKAEREFALFSLLRRLLSPGLCCRRHYTPTGTFSCCRANLHSGPATEERKRQNTWTKWVPNSAFSLMGAPHLTH